MDAIIAAAQRIRGRCRSSRLRLPVGKCRLRPALRGSWIDLRRALGRSRSRAWARRSNRSGSPKPPGSRPFPAITATRRTSTVFRRRRADRLSGVDQGVGRRRRAGHAPGRSCRRLAAAIVSARAEAEAAFGDSAVLLEKSFSIRAISKFRSRATGRDRCCISSTRLLGPAQQSKGSGRGAGARTFRKKPEKPCTMRRCCLAAPSITTRPARSSSSWKLVTTPHISWK